jgi:hypothetical protein
MFTEGADSDEIEYENYLAIKVFPDDSILMTLKGSHSETISPWKQLSAKGFDIIMEITSPEEDVTDIDNRFFILLSPSMYASMANLDVDLEGHIDNKNTNVTLFIDYPGYIGVSGSLGIVIVDAPYRAILDIDLETKLFYNTYPQESISMIVAQFPILETQIAAQIMEATDGHIVLEKLELLSLEEGLDFTSFTVRLRIAGDIQKGLQSLAEGMGAEITQPDDVYEVAPLTIESFDFHITFDGNTLTLEVDNGGSVKGDFNGQLNNFKDMSVEQLLNNLELDEGLRTLIARALPIDLDALNMLLEFSYSLEDDQATYTISLDELGLRPPSFKTLLIFLEDLSQQESLADYKLVLKGESMNNQYVAFEIPDETKDPILVEEQMVAWRLENIDNLEDVTYEVKTKQTFNTSTIIAASVIGLLVIGTVGFLRMRL